MEEDFDTLEAGRHRAALMLTGSLISYLMNAGLINIETSRAFIAQSAEQLHPDDINMADLYAVISRGLSG